MIRQSGTIPVPTHQHEQNAKADEEIHKRHNDLAIGTISAWEINLADQIRISDQAIGSLAQPGGKERPRQDTGKHHQRVRCIAIRRQFGDSGQK